MAREIASYPYWRNLFPRIPPLQCWKSFRNVIAAKINVVKYGKYSSYKTCICMLLLLEKNVQECFSHYLRGVVCWQILISGRGRSLRWEEGYIHTLTFSIFSFLSNSFFFGLLTRIYKYYSPHSTIIRGQCSLVVKIIGYTKTNWTNCSIVLFA